MDRRKLVPLRTFRDDLLFPIQKEFDKLYEEFFNNRKVFDSVKGSVGYPKMDLSVENGCWVVRCAAPGVKPEDLKVEMDGDVVKVTGRMSQEYQSPDGSEFVVRELHKGKFVRGINVSELVGITGDPEASMENGILTLKWDMKKEEVKPQPKVIEVKTS